MVNISIVIIAFVVHYASSSLLFKLRSNYDRCYIEELYVESNFIIKWKVFKPNKGDINQYLPHLFIYITTKNYQKEVLRKSLNDRKGKISFTAKESGVYRICGALRTPYKMGVVELMMNMRFDSNQILDTNKAITSKDISNIEMKVKDIIEIGKPIIESQKNDLRLENYNAEATIKFTKWYKYLTLIQIIICFMIGIFQLNTFRRFLKKEHII